MSAAHTSMQVFEGAIGWSILWHFASQASKQARAKPWSEVLKWRERP